jgi:two-component system NtrC family sensor kinase
VFRKADGDRVLGIIQPIQNQQRCATASCHAHSPDQSLLGVLDVTVSLAEMDAQIVQGRVRMAVLTVLAIVASSLILAWMTRRLVVRPVRALAAGTRALANGDLTTRIPETGSHELGELARAFNSMTEKLAEARHQVVQAEKLASVGRLAAGVAHEINNPLTGVLTYASLLRRQVEDRPEFAEDLDVIVRETKRCREIVKGLLDFSRQTVPDRKSIDVNEVVRRAIAVVMHRLKLRRVSLDLDLSPNPEIVLADANQIQQVVVNLLLNAVDALGPEGGTVRLETRSSLAPPGNGDAPHGQRPAGIEIVVQDSGHGIPAETLAHVFDPFFSTKGVRGTGLGLAVSWGIVTSHGGSIGVKSEVDEGTRFSVWLPRETRDERYSSVA